MAYPILHALATVMTHTSPAAKQTPDRYPGLNLDGAPAVPGEMLFHKQLREDVAIEHNEERGWHYLRLGYAGFGTDIENLRRIKPGDKADLEHIQGTLFTDRRNGATVDAARLCADYARLQAEANELRDCIKDVAQAVLDACVRGQSINVKLDGESGVNLDAIIFDTLRARQKQIAPPDMPPAATSRFRPR